MQWTPPETQLIVLPKNEVSSEMWVWNQILCTECGIGIRYWGFRLLVQDSGSNYGTCTL